MRIYFVISARSNIAAMAIWPIIIANKTLKAKGLSAQTLLHEKIHHQQQLELLVIPFYLWYVIEWLLKWVIYKDRKRAYKELSFEREAYSNDNNMDYLKQRRLWGFIKYL
ncbi:hypothetical protein [Olivibacter domesticus]|uniref:DUF4157 domain-containing protein n=1 Tax=Olivibacter domesticus TaxID=407022 RepID=A0A1H7YJ95_OLID1|nr:hypothetical protein [Olivibacter domesticus]SEM45388.1 hypothetical protein SAMN05661044_05228 [Olivibacter domesticus]